MSKKVMEGQLDFFDLLKEEPAEQQAPPKPEAKADDPDRKKNIRSTKKQALFKECVSCWCSDCRHNSRNEGIPREMCGKSMACPACDMCVSEGKATVCIIGNAKEGCMTRASEEGIYVPLSE